jgi:putative hemolysin
MSSGLPLAAALVVVAWLTAGRMAVRSVSRIWLRHWAEQQLRGAEAAVTYLEHPHRLLTAANISVAIALLVAGMIIGLTGPHTVVAVSALVFAALAIVGAQLIPRAIARRWPTVVAPLVLPVLRAADVLTMPLAAAGTFVARLVTRAPIEASPPAERDAIQDLLREGELEGVGERNEIAIISGVVDFSEMVVRDVMTPRADIFALPDATDAHGLALQIAQSRYSRVPIYHETLDRVVGMVHVFDVIAALDGPAPAVRPVAFFAPGAPCNELLFRMLRERLHLAIVRDDAAGGPTVGLVTLEDLLEELVGDIRDEHDDPETPRAGKPA